MNDCLWTIGVVILTGYNESSLSVFFYSTKPAWNGLSLILGLRVDLLPTKLLSHRMAQQFLLHYIFVNNSIQQIFEKLLLDHITRNI